MGDAPKHTKAYKRKLKNCMLKKRQERFNKLVQKPMTKIFVRQACLKLKTSLERQLDAKARLCTKRMHENKTLRDRLVAADKRWLEQQRRQMSLELENERLRRLLRRAGVRVN